MKNKWIFYLVITIPAIILGLLVNADLINSFWFTTFLLQYLFVFRTYTDGKRLADKGVIKKGDMWTLVIPGTRLQYFKELYLH
jgi:hypothetical protein